MPLRTTTKVRIAQGLWQVLRLARSVAGKGPEAVADRHDCRWALDLREGIDLALYLGVFERDSYRLWPSLVPDGGVVLDLGANIGAHTLPFARHAGPQGRVVAVEPTAWAFAKLTRNIALNPTLTERITAVQAVLLEDGGVPPEALSSSWPLAGARDDVHDKLCGRPMSLDGAQALTVDALVADLGLSRVDLIKLDVDGYECKILRGATRVLAEYRPRIVVELSPYALEEAGDSGIALVDVLIQAGYRLTTLDGGRPVPTAAEALARFAPDGTGFNMMAEPA